MMIITAIVEKHSGPVLYQLCDSLSIQVETRGNTASSI